MVGIAFGLGASLMWGVGDFIGGLQVRRSTLMTVMVCSQCISLLILTCVVLVSGASPADPGRLLAAAGAGLALIVGFLSYYQALAIGTMSIVSPIAATGVAIPVIAGIATGDRPAPAQVLGIVVAIVGVVLATREGGTAPEYRSGSTSIVLALVSAVGFGVYYVAFRYAGRDNVVWTLFSARVAGVVLLLSLAAWRLRVPLKGAVRRTPDRPPLRNWDAAALRRQFPMFVVISLFDIAGNVFYVSAGRNGLLSVVAVAASLYPLAIVVLGRVVLGERVARIQEVGIATAMAGVLMIAAG